MPAWILLIIQGLQAAIRFAPDAELIVKKAKDLFTSFFGAGLISKEQQTKLFEHLNDLQNAALAGTVPPEFQVDPDPATVAPSLPKSTESQDEKSGLA